MLTTVAAAFILVKKFIDRAFVLSPQRFKLIIDHQRMHNPNWNVVNVVDVPVHQCVLDHHWQVHIVEHNYDRV